MVGATDFSQQYLQGTLLVSLLSVWVLVALFFYLNLYTKRRYFTVWMTAWLFYALWLTLGLTFPGVEPSSLVFTLRQWCVAISAVFLLWGSALFLNVPVRETTFGLFMLFLMVWSLLSPRLVPDHVQVQMPLFILIGLGSLFAGVSFYRLRRKMPFVGAGMLSLGFFLWGLYLATYPLSLAHPSLYHVGFLVAAVLQLFIAVSMIVLVLEEVRYHTDMIRAEMEAVRSEKEALQAKVLCVEEQCRNLYDQVRLTEGLQRAYDELRQTQQLVVQQERLRALGQMASGIVHDINNALSPIIAYSDLLLSSVPDLPETARRYIEVIRRAGADIAQTVARVREFYRRRSPNERLVATDVNKVVEEVVELTRPRWRDQAQRQGIAIEVKCELAPELPKLWCDPAELREALTNLIFNAVDALPRGGCIKIVTKLVPAEPDANGNVGAQRIQLEVHDNGIGMDETTRQRCMEPFFSTKTTRGGTGLGLAMVYGMMQRHEGSIEVESALGKGTCVRLTFPVREAPVTAKPAEARRPEPVQPLNVLCIDDDPQMQQILKDCLPSFGHKVSVARSGRQGLTMFKAALKKQKPYDAVITDLGMPHVNGKLVTELIKAESPNTPVIMLTGWGHEIRDEPAVAKDVDAVLPKPPSIKDLNELLIRFARKRASTGTTPA
ncbi:MAG: ATP-binding protein [Verrucomicrobiae bacterium]|nr:ATP-binding protein [Verrucomicrobiae bacterium]MDW7979062.1 ATP-binding protein [Verrucomicrobiales bacterium]